MRSIGNKSPSTLLSALKFTSVELNFLLRWKYIFSFLMLISSFLQHEEQNYHTYYPTTQLGRIKFLPRQSQSKRFFYADLFVSSCIARCWWEVNATRERENKHGFTLLKQRTCYPYRRRDKTKSCTKCDIFSVPSILYLTNLWILDRSIYFFICGKFYNWLFRLLVSCFTV